MSNSNSEDIALAQNIKPRVHHMHTRSVAIARQSEMRKISIENEDINVNRVRNEISDTADVACSPGPKKKSAAKKNTETRKNKPAPAERQPLAKAQPIYSEDKNERKVKKINVI